MQLLEDDITAGPNHARDRRNPIHPLRRAKDYTADGERRRRWSAPERSYRLTYRRRPILTLASTALVLVLPTTLVYAGATLGSSAPKPQGTGSDTTNTFSLSSGPKSPVMPVGSVVTVGRAGYALTSVTIAAGQGVTFYNTDTSQHSAQVLPAEGVQCTSAPLLIEPGEYQPCTFTAEGSYAVFDPTNPAASPLTVTVVPDSGLLSSVDLVVDRSSVTRGASVTFMGSVNVPQSGIQIDIIAKDKASGAYFKVGEARTSATGAFSFAARPSTATVYFANAISAGTIVTSSKATVAVLKAQNAAETRTAR